MQYILAKREKLNNLENNVKSEPSSIVTPAPENPIAETNDSPIKTKKNDAKAKVEGKSEEDDDDESEEDDDDDSDDSSFDPYNCNNDENSAASSDSDSETSDSGSQGTESASDNGEQTMNSGIECDGPARKKAKP